MQIQLLWITEGTVYILSFFIFQLSSFVPLFLPLESDPVGMWRVMSPLVENGHFCISVALCTILPWPLLHKMKTKADKDVGMRGGRGRHRNGKRRMEKECFKHSQWLFPQFLSVCNSLGSNPLPPIQYTLLIHIHCSSFHEKLCAEGKINTTLTIRISRLDIYTHNL